MPMPNRFIHKSHSPYCEPRVMMRIEQTPVA
jgi:hypothetical protein